MRSEASVLRAFYGQRRSFETNFRVDGDKGSGKEEQ